jgi:RND family efflux transporter MFP subunit
VLAALVKLRKPPQRSEHADLPPLVTVRPLAVEDVRMTVRGYGTVRAKVRVEVVPQVAGKVVHIHKQFGPGGFVKAGEGLINIDPRDYELAVRQARAAVAEARVKVETEKAEAEVARREWVQLHGQAEPSSPLVFRRPQIQQAEAKLQSAEAALARAELDLERTEVSLPVDVYIVDQEVDLGQFVSTGQRVGSAYGTESMEIEVPLEDRDLAWFSVGDRGGQQKGSGPGSTARVTTNLAGGQYTWTGEVKRTTGRIDDTTRQIFVVVEVADPFEGGDDRPFLLPGTFVEVAIEGKVVRDVIAVPRTAVRGRNGAWVCIDGRLRIRRIEIARADRDYVYVTDGLADGQMLVLSSLDVATEGMRVRSVVDGESMRETASRSAGGANRP